MIRGAGALLVALAVAAPAQAQAQDDDAVDRARSLFEHGVRLLAGARHAEAASALEDSLALRPSPPAMFNLGLAYRGTGAYRRAIATFERFIEMSGEEHQVQVDQARGLIEQLSGELAVVLLRVDGAPDEVRVDGEAVSMRGGSARVVLDPGQHVVTVIREGYRPHQRRLRLGSGDSVELTLDAARRPHRARLVVDVAQPEADLFVDDRPVDASQPLSLVPGPYRLRVVASGYEPEERRIDLAPGATERWAVDLSAPPLWERWWFWAAVGGSVAVGLTLALVLPVTVTEEVDGGSLGTVAETLEAP